MTTGAETSAQIAALLKKWRGERSLTQSAAAKLLGVPVRTYEGWEAGRIGKTLQRLLRLAIRADQSIG